MSLINQMLQDLEQRRTATVGVSPLGGVNATNSLLTRKPLNTVMLGLVILLALVVAFLVGMQQSKTSVIEVVPVAQPTQSMADAKLNENQSGIVTMAPLVQSVRTAPAADDRNSLVRSNNTKSAQPLIQQAAQQSLQQSLQQPSLQSSLQSSQQTSTLVKTELVKAENKAVKKADQAERRAESAMKPVNAVSKYDLDDDAAGVASTDDIGTRVTPESIEKRTRPLTNEQRAEEAFRAAVKSLGQGKLSAAELKLDEALRLDANHVRARETKAAALLNQGRISEAGATLKQGLLLKPQAAPLAKLYARILMEQGDVSQAILTLQQAQSAAADDLDYQALLAALYQQVENHVQAAATYQRILAIRSNVAQWWLGLAISLESLHDSAQALNAYQQAWRLGGLTRTVRQYIAQRIESLSAVQDRAKEVAKADAGGAQ